jgi:hypothetical protein
MTIVPGSSTISASIGFTAGNTDNKFKAVKELSGFTTTSIAAEEYLTRELVNSATPGPIAGLHSTSNGSRRRSCLRLQPAPAPFLLPTYRTWWPGPCN